tara:strand:+ start:188 stop:886 length:699 start_codon:yes stop_codon:yes gene_type:complete
MRSENRWYQVMPPNINILKCELADDAINYLWDCIEVAKESKVSANSHLAGNIDESLYLKDDDDWFFKKVLQGPCESYIEQFSFVSTFRNNYTNVVEDTLRLREFWMNTSKQHDFNPMHNHGGVLSFVVWMKIPTKSEEQHNIPISKNSFSPTASDFCFTYTDILGTIQPMKIAMDPECEGTMYVFPSALTHQVYPFYNCDDDRISISGNLYYDVQNLLDSDDARNQEFGYKT